eukprot:339883-Amphidinium_carterae.4
MSHLDFVSGRPLRSVRQKVCKRTKVKQYMRLSSRLMGQMFREAHTASVGELTTKQCQLNGFNFPVHLQASSILDFTCKFSSADSRTETQRKWTSREPTNPACQVLNLTWGSTRAPLGLQCNEV